MNKIYLLFILLIAISVQCFAGKRPIQIRDKGSVNNHTEHFIPADEPDVYFDNSSLEIIIEADGFASYYDVEIYPDNSAIAVISTQISGYGDTIDVSSLPAAEYVITIYSPEDNTYEGFFEIL